ncbi:RNA-directed DNA polymerase, eukaryota [Tanacetum coccineum]|uniref:RNA-directed DNA polymerase, eukaryota n=1 Tax=Tanacetum coccineum TaxID=301880 RepID=A0ABQ5FT45_9ASTR
MEKIEVFCIKKCWGNFAFDYAYIAYVGNSGEILCVWDPIDFKNLNELTEKRLLWDYLSLVMENWNGEVIIMGDFNEVRKKAERFGSVFNVQGADAFNMFISNAGLEEVPLGGCSFTWCHKSANKMSKLDLFLISESLLSLCPNISVVSLDRYLSDHRSILMRESYYDYGHVPFRFFHYWFDMEGFDKLVEESWKAAPVADTNAIIKMMKKLKYLKENIHKGEGDEDVVNKRANVDRSLQELEKLQSVEVAQKAKIKWAIKGDENSNEFLSHFKKCFDQPQKTHLQLDLNFPNILNSNQQADLECEVTKDEIKRAVWDCGTDKSRGPDGFTFDFYRRYWKIIESDVVDADFASLSNLKVVLASNDFIIDGRVTWVEIVGIPLKMWSENTFNRIASIWDTLLHVENQEDECYHRKRICINTNVKSNIFESFKAIYQGKVFWVRAKEIPKWVPDIMEDDNEESDMDDAINEEESNGEDVDFKKFSASEGDNENEVVPDSMFEDELHEIDGEEVYVGQNKANSEDPFNLYDLLNKKKDENNKGDCVEDSLKFPPGFTPKDSNEVTEERPNTSNESKRVSGEGVHSFQEEDTGVKKYGSKKKAKDDVVESMCPGHFQKPETPWSGGSILQSMDDMVKVGQTVGYNMEKCIKNMEEIIESQGVNEDYR